MLYIAVLTVEKPLFSLTFAFVAVDSWRSALTDFLLIWQNKNQRCCYMQRGSSVYRQSLHITMC